MKKIGKSAKIWQNYGHESVAPFWPTLYVHVELRKRQLESITWQILKALLSWKRKRSADEE